MLRKSAVSLVVQEVRTIDFICTELSYHANWLPYGISENCYVDDTCSLEYATGKDNTNVEQQMTGTTKLKAFSGQ